VRPGDHLRFGSSHQRLLAWQFQILWPFGPVSPFAQADLPSQVFVEVEDEVLMRDENTAALEAPRAHPELTAFANLEILPVGDIEQFDRVGGIESRIHDCLAFEEPVTSDPRLVRTEWLQTEKRHMVRYENEKYVGQQDDTVEEALICVDPRQWPAGRVSRS